MQYALLGADIAVVLAHGGSAGARENTIIHVRVLKITFGDQFSGVAPALPVVDFPAGVNAGGTIVPLIASTGFAEGGIA